MSITRKWILRELPDIVFDSEYYMEQFYSLATDKEERYMRKVVLKRGLDRRLDSFVMTHVFSNKEYSTLIGENEYEYHRKRCILEGFPPIIMNYYTVCMDYYLIEFSIVDGGAFICAEVDFGSIEEANQYEFPWSEFIIKEVTNDDSFSIKNYWRRGYIPLDV